MKTYEYIRVFFDPGDLKALNSFGGAGFHVVSVQPCEGTSIHDDLPGEKSRPFMALLERENA